MGFYIQYQLLLATISMIQQIPLFSNCLNEKNALIDQYTSSDISYPY